MSPPHIFHSTFHIFSGLQLTFNFLVFKCKQICLKEFEVGGIQTNNYEKRKEKLQGRIYLLDAPDRIPSHSISKQIS